MNLSLSDKILKVSEFNELFDKLVSYQTVIIEGEISQINISQNKWLFLTLKDQSSQIEIFAVAFNINTLSLLKEGMLVHVYGTPHIHQKSGRFRVTADQIIPKGLGELKIAFEMLKLKLEKEGLFAVERKRPIPEYPTKIALLTAENSQAYHDFIKILNERTGNLEIFFFPIAVQGADSVKSIVKTFNHINQNYNYLDFAVLTRGGGSLEDLQSFNNEEVVKAIFSSKIPVVSAVGHEKDITLADLVADLRASTPSNAAEIISRDKKEIFESLTYLKKHFESILDQNLRNSQTKVSNFFDIIDSKLKAAISQLENSFKNFTRILNSLNIDNTLKRGFSITFHNNKILRDVNLVAKGDIIKSQLFNGTIWSKTTQ